MRPLSTEPKTLLVPRDISSLDYEKQVAVLRKITRKVEELKKLERNIAISMQKPKIEWKQRPEKKKIYKNRYVVRKQIRVSPAMDQLIHKASAKLYGLIDEGAFIRQAVTDELAHLGFGTIGEEEI